MAQRWPEVIILRIYNDAEGESHFEDVEFAFEQTDLVPPAPPVFMTELEAANRYERRTVQSPW